MNKIYLGFHFADTAAFLWFFMLWVGYTRYAEWKAQKKECLASVLHLQRYQWMMAMLGRENRVADASLIANLERNVAFFASSTLIILAGILTVLGATDKAILIAAELPFSYPGSTVSWEIKLIMLLAIFVYAFFKFSWALRQYGFASVVIGCAPSVGSNTLVSSSQFADGAGKIISRAAYAFNLGLRSYYFGLAFLVWFVNPWFFIFTTALVVAVLYRREFHSNALKALILVKNSTMEKASGN